MGSVPLFLLLNRDIGTLLIKRADSWLVAGRKRQRRPAVLDRSIGVKGGIVLKGLSLVYRVENPVVVRRMKQDGTAFEHPRGMNLALLPHAETRYHEDGSKRHEYRIPVPFCFFKRDTIERSLGLYGTECGGGHHNGRFASVVCGESGNPIRPLSRVSGFSAEFYDQQAEFLLKVSGACVGVRLTRSGKARVVIRNYWVRMEEDMGIVLVIYSWSGWYGNILPRKFARFAGAVEAAYRKLESDKADVFYVNDARPSRASAKPAESSALVTV